MRAWQIAQLHTAPVLADVPIPVPSPGQALVRIRACALNFADLLMAEGSYQDKPALPYIPGLEWAGEVVALGSGIPEGSVTGTLAVGTRVACASGTGGLAEYGCFDIGLLIPIPDAMPFDHAAAFPVAYGTSHLALTHKARLQPGETLFVTGAAGGVGLTAVEIGKRLGARVIASARGGTKLAVARAAGADVLIDSDAPDLRAALLALGGADVVYDAVGGPAFDAALRATNPDGRLICIGFASGTVPLIKANHILVKNISVMGFWWGGYRHFAPNLLNASLATLLGWYKDGGLRPHISATLPFHAALEGLEMLRTRTATGKVVIEV